MQGSEQAATRKRRQTEPRLEPYRIAVPDPVAKDIDALVERFASRTGEPPENVRRAVEISVLCRGIERVKGEEGLR